LDEGVNIPSIKTAFILASSTNPKEYVQRRGRVLRKSPETGKLFSVIYDFITLATPLENVDPYNSSYNCERTLAKRELVRMREFGGISKNSRDSDELMTLIQDAYNISDAELEDAFDGIEYQA
jgi:superfamily II DNA or RNA helicase